jgi:hypothetical protein
MQMIYTVYFTVVLPPTTAEIWSRGMETVRCLEHNMQDTDSGVQGIVSL